MHKRRPENWRSRADQLAWSRARAPLRALRYRASVGSNRDEAEGWLWSGGSREGGGGMPTKEKEITFSEPGMTFADPSNNDVLSPSSCASLKPPTRAATRGDLHASAAEVDPVAPAMSRYSQLHSRKPESPTTWRSCHDFRCREGDKAELLHLAINRCRCPARGLAQGAEPPPAGATRWCGRLGPKLVAGMSKGRSRSWSGLSPTPPGHKSIGRTSRSSLER